MNYEEYEGLCNNIRDDNEKHLKTFQLQLEEKALSEKTIQSHLFNVRLYLNDFLLYNEAISMWNGYIYVDEFLGSFFIRKCMWSTPSTIKSTAASLKKFYKCMMECGEVEKEDYRQLCQIVKENTEEWCEVCRDYNDPDQDNPFFSF